MERISLPEFTAIPTASYMPTATVGIYEYMPTVQIQPSAYPGRRHINIYADGDRRRIQAVGIYPSMPTAPVGVGQPSAYVRARPPRF